MTDQSALAAALQRKPPPVGGFSPAIVRLGVHRLLRNQRTMIVALVLPVLFFLLGGYFVRLGRCGSTQGDHLVPRLTSCTIPEQVLPLGCLASDLVVTSNATARMCMPSSCPKTITGRAPRLLMRAGPPGAQVARASVSSGAGVASSNARSSFFACVTSRCP
jgi:hypothetical protein